MSNETPNPEFLQKLEAQNKQTQAGPTQSDLNTIDSAIKLTDLEEQLVNLDNNIFEYKRQSAVDLISITLEFAKSFLKSDYEKNPAKFTESNLKDQTALAIKSAETIALAITQYTESTFRQRMENGAIPDAFKTRKAELQLEITKLLETATKEPAILRNIGAAIKQGNQQLMAQQSVQVPGNTNQSRLKPLPNPELKKVIHSELNKNNLSIVEKPLTNVAPLGFKQPENNIAQSPESANPSELDAIGNEPWITEEGTTLLREDIAKVRIIPTPESSIHRERDYAAEADQAAMEYEESKEQENR